MAAQSLADLVRAHYRTQQILIRVSLGLCLFFGLVFLALSWKGLFGPIPSYACSYVQREVESEAERAERLAECESRYRSRQLQRAALFQVLPGGSLLAVGIWWWMIRDPRKTKLGRTLLEHPESIVSYQPISRYVRVNGVRTGPHYGIEFTTAAERRVELGVTLAQLQQVLQIVARELPEAELGPGAGPGLSY